MVEEGAIGCAATAGKLFGEYVLLIEGVSLCSLLMEMS
jgi:hypothetical protein